MCGGNISPMGNIMFMEGLSPLVRGKHIPVDVNILQCGSIPACAGETASAGMAARLYRVYPRLCGGNDDVTAMREMGAGLSPLVRGKRE